MNPGAPDPLQLRDIHLPADPGWWPPAPGWWLLAAVLVALLAWAVVFGWRRVQVRPHRPRVLAPRAALERDHASLPPSQSLARI